MSRVEAELRETKSKLIGYFPAGYPTVDASIEACLAMVAGGVNILEIGVPYSDPIMDGPAIQKANLEALHNGFKLTDIFKVIQGIRKQSAVPILVMTYWNPVLSYGLERFAADLVSSGGDGLITPDLIPDEATNWIELSDRLKLDRVFLVAPSSSDERVSRNAEQSRGFVYTVSTMGITGARAELDKLARITVAKVRASSSRPTAVGVGISTASQVAEVNSYADGAIVGSAFIAAYSKGGLRGLSELTKELAKGLL